MGAYLLYIGLCLVVAVAMATIFRGFRYVVETIAPTAPTGLLFWLFLIVAALTLDHYSNRR
jgi:hypothetical protein